MLILNLQEVTQKTVICKQPYHNKNKSRARLKQRDHYSAKFFPSGSRQGLLQLSHSRTRPHMRMGRNLSCTNYHEKTLQDCLKQDSEPCACMGCCSRTCLCSAGGCWSPWMGTAEPRWNSDVGRGLTGGICTRAGGGWLFCVGKTTLRLPRQPEEAQRRGPIN